VNGLQSGFSPLHIAAHYGNISVAGLLIHHGADVNRISDKVSMLADKRPYLQHSEPWTSYNRMLHCLSGSTMSVWRIYQWLAVMTVSFILL